MSVPAPLLTFVNDELARSGQMIDRCVAGTLALLTDSRDALTSSEREQHFQLVEALQRHGAHFQTRFLEALREGVHGELTAQNAALHHDGGATMPQLELMDEARVDVDIELSHAIQLIDSTAEWERRELQTFTSTLCGQEHVSEESNPLRPIVYATALWEAACAIVPAPKLRATLLRVSSGVLAGLLKSAWAAASSRLEAQGVVPSMYRTVLLTPGMVVARADTAPNAARADMLGALLQNLPSPSPAGDPGRAADPGSQVAALLSRLFTVIQADAQLPAAARGVLARLQVAALRVASQDASMLDAPTHPVWQLMNRIADASQAYPAPGDKRLTGLLAFCDALAEEISRAQVGDAASFRRALARLDAYLGEQVQWQLREASESVTSLQRAERREVLEQALSQRLTEQMAPVHAPAPIRRFVTSGWAKVLAESIVRFGEQVEPTPGYLRTVDDLLWSLHPPDHPQSRQRLVNLLPGLLQRLRSGMALIAMPEGEQQAVLDALMPIHAEALHPGPRTAGDQLTPEQLVQRMRDEIVPDTPLPRPFSDSVIDLTSMDTVPADFLAANASTPEEAARHIDTLQPGDRLRMLLRGRWTRVQLLWHSDKGLYLLFAGEQPGVTHSITRRALERLDSARLVKPFEDKPLVQRAIDTLANELPSPA